MIVISGVCQPTPGGELSMLVLPGGGVMRNLFSFYIFTTDTISKLWILWSHRIFVCIPLGVLKVDLSKGIKVVD